MSARSGIRRTVLTFLFATSCLVLSGHVTAYHVGAVAQGTFVRNGTISHNTLWNSKPRHVYKDGVPKIRHHLPLLKHFKASVNNSALLDRETREVESSVADPITCVERSDRNDKVIDFAVIVPSNSTDQYSALRVLPVVHLAVDHLRKEGLKGPLKGWDVAIHNRDSQCSSTYAPLAAVDLHLKGLADVFLGPVCKFALAPVARFAKVWDTLVMTPGGLPKAFDYKDTFPLLTRLRGYYSEVGEVFKKIISNWGWKTLGLLYQQNRENEGDSSCHFSMDAIFSAFNKTPAYRNFINASEIGETLQYFTNRARIMVICGQPSTIREIMLEAAKLNMIYGEYAFFNIELFTGTSSNYKPWYIESAPEEENDLARKAFESVIMMTARTKKTKEYKKFSAEVRKISERDFNETFDEEYLNPYVTTFYEAVLIYAKALNATLALGGNIANGTAVRTNLWNKTFEGINARNVSINAHGDREGDYTLLDMDPQTGEFQEVAVYSGETKTLNFSEVDIMWPGELNFPPADTPKCGFNNELCHDEATGLYMIITGVLAVLVLGMLVFSAFIYRKLRHMTREMTAFDFNVQEDIVNIIPSDNHNGMLVEMGPIRSKNISDSRSGEEAMNEILLFP